MSKAGNTYDAKGRLEEQTFTGEGGKKVDYVGFKPDFSGLPKSFLGHTFTADERAKIEGGGKVFITGLVSKKGNTFDATLSMKNDKIDLEFGK